MITDPIMRRVALYASLILCSPLSIGRAQPFTHADTLRGSITPQRAWWDVRFYDLHVKINPSDSSISGYNRITYHVVAPTQEMQIDLQEPLQIDSILQDGKPLSYRRDGNAFFVTLVAPQTAGTQKIVTAFYRGKPHVANNPPWEGGFTWRRDSLGHPLIITSCQVEGASIWWPNKDTWSDEPDSQRIAITVPDSLMDVSNGRLRSTTHHNDGTTTYEWFVKNPINNYDVAVNVGHYAHFSDVYNGEKGKLTLDFWPLSYRLEVARQHFQQVKTMLACFESWFGPYPWYEDGYKLVQTPFLGMEHQSAIAYGNGYHNGMGAFGGRGTAWGDKWDYAIIHESGHEWFGNNITAKDIADMWVHESFATYSEALYTECQYGKEAGAAYVTEELERDGNGVSIASYGVNQMAGTVMYGKGAGMLHTIRQIINNDSKWRNILRGLNKTFWHQTVTGQQVESYISAQAGIDLSKVFAQYLTTPTVPVLEYKIKDSTLSYRWAGVVPGFDMPVRVSLSEGHYELIRPTEVWQTARLHLTNPSAFRVDKNFDVTGKQVN